MFGVKVSIVLLASAIVAMTVSSIGPAVTAGADVMLSISDERSLTTGPPSEYPFTDFATVVDGLYQTETEHPEISVVVDIGDSWEKTQGIANRDILAIKISDNPREEEGEPEVLMMARHHANEAPPTEITLALIENLTDQYGVDSRVSWLVDNREIWIVPVVNPDGMEYFMSYDDTWRKNRHDNGDGSFGVDINRNYAGSENDDPLGAWGGVGASFDPASSVYCGEYAFSEPETQAIRDLVLSHDFQIAVDFHAAGGAVMWPWGYTTNLTPDNDALARIGAELADLNGYYALQSSATYLTTGDSLDWLYGGANVYPFLFEVGTWVDYSQPDQLKAVLGQIEENVPAAIQAIEIAGDRSEKQFEILHTPIEDSLYSDAGFDVSAEITAERGVSSSEVQVVYRVDAGVWTQLAMTVTDDTDSYGAVIPAQGGGSTVDYYIFARDSGGIELMSPRYAPYEVYTFQVLPDAESPVAVAGHDVRSFIGYEVVLDGSHSKDNVGIVSYVWSYVLEGAVVKVEGVSVSLVFEIIGTFEVTLTVTDGSENSDSDTVSVTIMDGRSEGA